MTVYVFVDSRDSEVQAVICDKVMADNFQSTHPDFNCTVCEVIDVKNTAKKKSDMVNIAIDMEPEEIHCWLKRAIEYLNEYAEEHNLNVIPEVGTITTILDSMS